MSNFSFSDSDQALWLYHYDSAGIYIGSGLAIVPAGTGLPAKTTITPCNSPEGKTGIWDGESWSYVLDNRGVRYWNKYGVGSVVIGLNDVIPTDAIFAEPPRKESGFVLLYQDGEWLKLADNTGKKYYAQLGESFIVPDAYFTLPAMCTFIEPPAPKPGMVVFWNSVEWGYIEDHRGKTAYLKSTGQSIIVSDAGPLADQYTFLPPATPFDKWNGDAWVTDDNAKQEALVEQAQSKKSALRVEADSEIAVLADAIKYGIATEAEKEALDAWSQYRVLLMRIEPSTAPDIVWPVKP